MLANLRPELIGMVVINTDPMDLIAALDMGEHYETWLVDGDGYYLRHGDPKREWGFEKELGRSGARFSEEYPEAWEQISRSGMPDIFLEQDWFHVTETVDLGSDLDDSRVTLVMTQDTTTLFGAADGLRVRILLLSILTCVLVALIGRWGARRITSPLLELASKAKRLAEGDEDLLFYPGGSDEVGRLATALTDLVDSLQRKSLEARAALEIAQASRRETALLNSESSMTSSISPRLKRKG